MQTTQSDRTASPFVEPWEPSQRFIIITAIVVALIASLGTATFVVQRIWYTPDAAVSGYFGALEDRDAEKAASYLESNDTSVASGLITSDKYVPPTALKVKSTKKDDDRVSAEISYSVGDKLVTGSLPLRRSEELTWGMFRGWSVAGSRPALRISTSAPVDVQVNGQSVDTSSGELTVFPGRYVVGIADNTFLETDPVTVDAGFDDIEVELLPRIKETIRTDADKQIKQYLTGCLVAATKPEHNCPFSIGYDELTSPVWRIDTYPTVELRLDSSGEGITVQTTTDGMATVTGKGYGGAPYTDTDSFSISGTVSVDQGKVTFQPSAE